MSPHDTREPRKILVVEADPAIRALVVALLHREGHATEAVDNADAAFEARSSSSLAAVIVDPRMRGGDTLLAALRKDAEIGAKVIIITTPDWRQPAYPDGDGVCGVLLKPFFLEELAALVTSCLSKESSAARPRDPKAHRGNRWPPPDVSMLN